MVQQFPIPEEKGQLQTLEIRRGLEAHAHFRQGEMARAVLPFTIEQFGAAIAMPNIKPPLRNAGSVIAYKAQMDLIAGPTAGFRVFPLMLLTENTTPSMVIEAHKHGAIGVKILPAGVTTNSEDGVINYNAILPALEVVYENDMVASFHCEHPDTAVEGPDKERAFLRTILVPKVIQKLPGLKIVIEHVSTAEGVEFVKRARGNVAATITPHHLFYTTDDVLGYSLRSKGKLNPHLMCKPVIKGEADRQALISAAMSGNPKFLFGGDTAPHPRKDKESGRAPSGVFCAPVALPALATLFEQNGKLGMLEAFVSVYGFRFWGIQPSDGYVTLVREPWTVPNEYHIQDTNDTVVPMMAGETLPWRVGP